MTPTREKLNLLRRLMQQAYVDYYFVPSSDPHNNEYVPPNFQRRAWISEFTGSAGDALIGLNEAYLWTDPRYFLQAEQELDANYFQLMRQQQGLAPPIDEWLKQNATSRRIGVDPKLMTINHSQKWQRALKSVNGELIYLPENLIDHIWHDQPKLVTHPIKILDIRYTGKSTQEKLALIRTEMKIRGVQAHVINLLDAIAWVFNIRGQDIYYNPLIISYAIITLDKAILFLDIKQIKDSDTKYFASYHIEIAAYNDFQRALNQLHGNVLVDPGSASVWILQQLNQAEIVYGESPITLMKACKNPVEIQGMREAHRKDALAMCQFLYWLENHWQGLSELEAAEKLTAFRLNNPDCQGLSFETISAFAEHGAIVHYRVTKESNKLIDDKHLYLIDSGGQYFEGTTDITRIIHLGKPTSDEKHHYTLVLKGHLSLGHAVFPENTKGEHLNALAHLPLWKEGLDYGHGTGHGVGCYLCVHEGPQRISAAASNVSLKNGMMVSNEPGLYFEGKYGIRIENVCLIKDHDQFPSFYQLEDLTLVPYARNLINKDELSKEEIVWINEYHQKIYSILHKDLPEEVQQWLLEATKEIL